MTDPKTRLNRYDLKKQSQFAPDLKSVNSFLKGDYENKSRPGSRKNKANQSMP